MDINTIKLGAHYHSNPAQFSVKSSHRRGQESSIFGLVMRLFQLLLNREKKPSG